MSMYKLGNMTPIRGITEPSHREMERYRNRKPDTAIREKMKVLEEFGIVNDRNREVVERDMTRAIADSQDVHFDRVLDGFARKLISEKLGG